MPAVEALIFAKYPEPGRVKTRMCPPLTAEQAAMLHGACLAATMELVRAVGSITARLVVTPDEKAAAFAALPGVGGIPVDTQGPGDLGERLQRAVGFAAGRGADAVILLGADSPTLPWPILEEAVGHLRRGDAVLGPTHDGGYYLLGLPLCVVGDDRPWIEIRERILGLLADIAWGTEQVAVQTRDRARSARMNLAELPYWYDLDRAEDLSRALTDFDDGSMAHRPAAARLAELLRQLTTEGP